ncbi:hypothetical protein ACH429_23635 [Streptomyces pathocidini]|uniref:Uncharacterized protein n=1 Tax=Streptomyces pathocidini TaxID=1650571 RepID=A0ABW7UWV1_9ACTN|nr:hypothetical protein [Streptomyces pathocidini]
MNEAIRKLSRWGGGGIAVWALLFDLLLYLAILVLGSIVTSSGGYAVPLGLWWLASLLLFGVPAATGVVLLRHRYYIATTFQFLLALLILVLVVRDLLTVQR